MNQRQIERAVAAATGESLGTIRRRGFGIVQPPTDVDEHGPEFAAKENIERALTSDLCRSAVGRPAA